MRSKTLKNIILILACTIVGKLLSYVWEAVLAAKLGTSDQADAFYMTTSVFTILYPILDIGIWKVFLPIYKKLATNEEEKANSFASTALTAFLCISAVLVVFLLVFAKPIVMIIAPGFSPDKKALTTYYLRISAPSYFLMASASVIGAVLECHGRFFGSQLRQIGTHASKIIYLFVLYKYIGIYAALTAALIGSIVRLIIQLPFINWGWKYKPDFRFGDPNVRDMLKGLPSVGLTVAIANINELIDKMIASGAHGGAVSCLNYGNKLVNVFSGMVSSAIVTAVYPTMIQHIAKNEDEKLRSLVNKSISALIFVIVPVSAFCILFSGDIVSAAFERGAFTPADTVLTGSVFLGYAAGMLFTAIAAVITSVFYGYGNTKINLMISVLNIALNVVFDLILYRFLGIMGLAIATSISAAICLVVSLILLKKYIRLGYRRLLTELIKVLLISAVSVIPAYVLFGRVLSLNVYLSLILSVIMIAAIYMALSKLLELSSQKYIFEFIRGFLKRKRTDDKAE